MSVRLNIRIKTIVIVLIVFFAKQSPAQSLIYMSTISGNVSNSETTIIKNNNGYHITTVNDASNNEHVYITDTSFSCLKWMFKNPENGIDIVAVRSDSTIYLTGQFRNEGVDKQYKIDDSPWYEGWGIGLKEFILSDKESIDFWSISPEGLRIAKFTAKKKRKEKIKAMGCEIESVYTTIKLKGLLKMFWSGGEMWFRTSDGICVLTKMQPDAPEDVTQLMNER